MHLNLTDEEQLFRAELREWLVAHAPREKPPKVWRDDLGGGRATFWMSGR